MPPPPGFVVRPNGTAFIFGVIPDQDAFLPPSLGIRVRYERFIRFVKPRPKEDLAGELREHGLQQFSESVWLKSPKPELPDKLLSRVVRRLERQSLVTVIDNLKVLDSARPVTHYRDRWVIPTNQTGTFVARRPQEFGAPMWCLVRMEDGVPVRLLDIPFEKTRWRACDTAWHLQLAIDHCLHRPQRYRRSQETCGTRLDFFSPLPLWAERRLMVFGTPCRPKKGFLAYVVPRDHADTEEEFLQSKLWLTPTADTE